MLLTPGAATALPMYTITDLGNLPDGNLSSSAVGINNHGQVVGTGFTITGDFRAVLYQDGVVTDLGALPGGFRSQASGINDHGQVVGTGFTITGDFRPFLWQSGVGMTDLGDLPGGLLDLGAAYGINDSGQVAGYSTAVNGVRAFLWDSASGMTDLGDLPGGFDYSQANAINDGGQVVGYSEAATGVRAFLWDSASGMTDLGDLPGGPDQSVAYGINNSGQVVGHSTAATGERAFLWDNASGMTDLGDLPGGNDYSAASDINDSGQVVGFSYAATGGRAFLWDNVNGMLDLNDLLIDANGWNLSDARAINASGQIAGNGYHNGSNHGFLLTPVDAGPPPVNAAAPDTTDLARLSSKVYDGAPDESVGDFEPIGNIGEPSDLLSPYAEAYIRRGENEGQDQVVIAIRGTDSSTDILRDFAAGVPLPEAADALFDSLKTVAQFVKNISAAHPNADFTFTGHSLGGAMATILAKASNVDATVFNSPGTSNLESSERREELASIMGGLGSSSNDTVTYRHFRDFVSTIGLQENDVKTVYAGSEDFIQHALESIAPCVPCHAMDLMQDLLEEPDADIRDGFNLVDGGGAPTVIFGASIPLEVLRKAFNATMDENFVEFFDPPLFGDIIEIDLGLSDTFINGIIVGALEGDEFPLQALSDTAWIDIGVLFPYELLDVASYQKYRILNASDLVDDFGNFIVGLRFDRDGTFRGTIGAPESTQPVPEPGTLLLLGTGLLALLCVRRKWSYSFSLNCASPFMIAAQASQLSFQSHYRKNKNG